MATQVAPQSVEDARESFCIKRIWMIAICAAIVGAIPVAIFKNSAPWLIAVPICLGTIIALVFETWDSIKPQVFDSAYGRISGPASGIPSGLEGLQEYQNFSLQFQGAGEAEGQGLFSFLQSRPQPTRKPRRVQLASGEEISVIGVDRYVELLVDRLLRDSDAIVEHALTMGATRFGGSGKLSKVILETIQSDFRGNWLTVVSRDAELVIRELEEKLRTGGFELKDEPAKPRRRTQTKSG